MACVSRADLGVLLQQRGLMLQRSGNNAEAQVLLDAAGTAAGRVRQPAGTDLHFPEV